MENIWTLDINKHWEHSNTYFIKHSSAFLYFNFLCFYGFISCFSVSCSVSFLICFHVFLFIFLCQSANFCARSAQSSMRISNFNISCVNLITLLPTERGKKVKTDIRTKMYLWEKFSSFIVFFKSSSQRRERDKQKKVEFFSKRKFLCYQILVFPMKVKNDIFSTWTRCRRTNFNWHNSLSLTLHYFNWVN